MKLLARAAGNWERLGFVTIMLLGAVTRLWNLGYPGKLVFDETYYVKDALTLSMAGYEMAWPEGANTAFESGEVFGYLEKASFVVHPPLGKWIIALGMWLVGPESSFGWRLSVALLGIASLAVLMRIAYQLFASKPMALAAGFLMAVDGLAIVMSRTALLDAILTFFLLAGFSLFLQDQNQVRRQIVSGADSGRPAIVSFRPYLILVGISLGAASSVKWSGAYLLAAVGLYLVVSETLLRRQLAEKGWFVRGVLVQGAFSFLNLVPPALATYLLTWLGWILSSDGYYRNWAEGNSLPGIFATLPKWMQSLWHYHEAILNFHVNLTSQHSYRSNPFTWLLGIRPTAFFYETKEPGSPGCESASSCSSAITALGNPLIWLGATAAIAFLAYQYLRYRERRVGLILLGVAALYLPWLLLTARTVFQFYSISFLPFMILALVLVLRVLHARIANSNQRLADRMLFGYFALVAAFAVFFFPIYTGIWLPFDFWQWRMWLPSWI